MQRKDAKTIIMYYRSIPEMKRLLQQECRELEDEYCGLHGISMDGMPHGTSPGSPVESAVVRLAESGASDRIREIENRVQVLEDDQRHIQSALDAVNGRYKIILTMRYLDGYSWGGISARIGAPDSTVRHWDSKALLRFGKALEDAGETGEILGRATRARV